MHIVTTDDLPILYCNIVYSIGKYIPIILCYRCSKSIGLCMRISIYNINYIILHPSR